MSEWPHDLEINMLMKCAYLSHYAYTNNTQNKVKSLSLIAFIDEKCWLFLDNSNEILYIAFRGSDSINDLAKNLCFMPTIVPDKTSGKSIGIHSGYYNYYTSVKDRVFACIDKYASKFNKVIVTGHSLGGACAVISSFDVQPTTNDVTCVTFGTPPMAHTEFVKLYDERVPKCYRVFNNEDWAPKLPVPGLQHVGQPVPLKTYNKCPQITHIKPSNIAHSHGMAKYVSCLRKHVQESNALYKPYGGKTHGLLLGTF